jgi:hypothetical protein
MSCPVYAAPDLITPSETPKIVITQAPVVKKTEYTSDEVPALIERLVAEYQGPLDLVKYISDHESRYGLDRIGDMDIICPKGINAGKPVRAKGVIQITDCYHPEISDEQAFDIEWSLRWAIPRIMNKETCLKEWTTCRRYYGQ